MGVYRCQCKSKISVATNSIFEKEKLSSVKIILLMYFFVHDFKYSDIKRECMDMDDTKISSSTISKWFKLFRKCCSFHITVKHSAEGKIGGLNKIVEVDETWISERKYNRGRKVNGRWILGMIERKSENFRLEVIQNKRSAPELLKLLKENVHVDSTVITDKWKSYTKLNDYFKRHQIVNHSTNFIQPETGANTQKIESSWRHLKLKLAKKRDGGDLEMHLKEYLYKRKLFMTHPDFEFDNFVRDVASSYTAVKTQI